MECDYKFKERGENYEEFEISKDFNGDTYTVTITVFFTFKAEKFWISASSGNKRKHKEIFEDKDYKSKGGIEALIWIKEVMLNFPKFYGNRFKKKQYIIVSWTDSRRRDIYKRLERYGFRFTLDEGKKVLMKKINYESSIFTHTKRL